MPGKRVEQVEVVGCGPVRVTVYYSPRGADKLCCFKNHYRLMSLKAMQVIRSLAHACFADKSGVIRPFFAGLPGWVWYRPEQEPRLLEKLVDEALEDGT